MPADAVEPKSVDATKGLLILLVVAGHNTVLTGIVPALFLVLYNFHVYAFLNLPATAAAPDASPGWIGDRAVRYLVPYAIFACASGALWRLQGGFQASGVSWFWALMTAVAQGSYPALKEATGLGLFWFLPALLSVNALRWVVARLKGAALLGAGALCVSVHCLCGGLPELLRTVAPMGVLNAIYVMPLLWVVAFMWKRFRTRWWALAGSCALAVGTGGALLLWLSLANVATLDVETVNHPILFTFHDVHVIAASFAVLAGGRWLKFVPGLQAVGRRSLAIYLSHSVFFHGLLAMQSRVSWAPPPPLNAVFTFATVVGASTCLGVALDSAAVKPWIFPRNSEMWPVSRVIIERIRRGRMAGSANGKS